MRNKRRGFCLAMAVALLFCHCAYAAESWSGMVVIVKDGMKTYPIEGSSLQPGDVLIYQDGTIGRVEEATAHYKQGSNTLMIPNGYDPDSTAVPGANKNSEIVKVESTDGDPAYERRTVIQNGEETIIIIAPFTPAPAVTPQPTTLQQFRENRQYYEGIAGAGNAWLKQIFINFHSLEARLYENSKHIQFRQMLSAAGDGGIRLTMQTNRDRDQLTFRVYVDALNYLQETGITEIVIVNGELVDAYRIADIFAVLEATGQQDATQIWLNGQEGDVYVLDRKGVKTQLMI